MASEAAPATLNARTSYGLVPLGFVREGATIFLIARDRAARWPIEFLRSGRAELLLPTGRSTGSAFLVRDAAEQAAVLGRFRRAYGPERFARWYDNPARILRIDLDAPPPDGDGSLVRYYDWLEAEFDNVAAGYDRHITGNRMNRLLRDRSLARLRALFRTDRRLLEIGCGSGMETLPMLREGHELVAVDISQRMLDVVVEKARKEGLSERLHPVKLRARDLDRLLEECPPRSFDGAYSTYGALNCEPDLSTLPKALHRLLRPKARFLAGVYNRWCLFEAVGYGVSLQWHRALGRRRNPVPVGTSRFCIDIYAHSPGDFERLFAADFEVEALEGVPAILPPSDLTRYAEMFSRHFETLARWDAWAGSRTPLARFGDHFLMTLRANPSTASARPAEARGE